MKTLVLASQKGGAGKTTLAAHLAVEAVKQGVDSVCVTDTDPQGNLASWWNKRQANDIAYATILQHAQMRKAGIALCVVDTPGIIDGNIEAVIALADFVLIPAAPSVLDLESVGKTASLLESAGKAFAFVVSRADMRTSLPTEMRNALAGAYPVAPVIVTHQPSNYVRPMNDGLTGDSPQIAELWKYVNEEMRK